MPGRQYSNDGYRYQYAGKESDAERHRVNYELRQYDGRLARWHNPDPLLQHYSPYVAMGNDPVNRIDPSGGTDYYVDGMKVPSAMGSRMMNEGTNILHIEVAMDEMGMFDIGAETNGISFYGGEQANFAAGNLAKLIDRVRGLGGSTSVDRSGNLTITRDVTVVEEANIKTNRKGQVLGMDWVISSVEVEEIIQTFEGLFEGFRPTKTATNEHFIFTGDQSQTNSLPTRTGGGYIDDYDDFYNFMVDQAKNNPDEVAAFEILDPNTNSKRYFVQPWDKNGPNHSHNDYWFFNQDGYTRQNIIAQYHSHPSGLGPSRKDALTSKEWGVPINSIGPGGKIWRVAYLNGPLSVVPFISEDLPILRFGKVIYNP